MFSNFWSLSSPLFLLHVAASHLITKVLMLGCCYQLNIKPGALRQSGPLEGMAWFGQNLWGRMNSITRHYLQPLCGLVLFIDQFIFFCCERCWNRNGGTFGTQGMWSWTLKCQMPTKRKGGDRHAVTLHILLSVWVCKHVHIIRNCTSFLGFWKHRC